jgi:hypothetical protein
VKESLSEKKSKKAKKGGATKGRRCSTKEGKVQAFLVLAKMVPFGCADKPAEKHCWLICCERKILF